MLLTTHWLWVATAPPICRQRYETAARFLLTMPTAVFDGACRMRESSLAAGYHRRLGRMALSTSSPACSRLARLTVVVYVLQSLPSRRKARNAGAFRLQAGPGIFWLMPTGESWSTSYRET